MISYKIIKLEVVIKSKIRESKSLIQYLPKEKTLRTNITNRKVLILKKIVGNKVHLKAQFLHLNIQIINS